MHPPTSCINLTDPACRRVQLLLLPISMFLLTEKFYFVRYFTFKSAGKQGTNEGNKSYSNQSFKNRSTQRQSEVLAHSYFFAFHVLNQEYKSMHIP